MGKIALKTLVFGMGMMIAIAAFQIPADYTLAAGANTPITGSAATPAPTANPEKPLQGDAGYKLASEKLNRVYAGLDVINKRIDRSLFEIDALADRLGSDPAAIFHFVRDEIRYEPYTGVLRGALGTLVCRAGNSLDRSLLLAALLEKRGFKTQIASGQLNAQQAKILVSRLFEPVKPVPSAVPSLADLAPDLSRAMGGDQAQLLRVATQAQENGEKRTKDLVNYVDGETNLLSNLLSKAGVDAGVITPNDQLLAEASDHYWVQYQDASGQWVDLDSAFTDAVPGKAVVSATDTFAPDSVPEDLYHHLQISLTLRVTQVVDGNDGPTSDTVLLDQGLRVAEQQGKNIILANSPIPTPSVAKPGVTLAGALAPTKGYQTLLQVGDRVLAGKYFDLDGKVSDSLRGPVGDVVTNAGGVGKSLGGITGGINDVFGGGPATQNPTRIIGEWVDYQLTSPRPNSGAPAIHNYHRDIIAPDHVTSWSANSPDRPELVLTKLDKALLRQRLQWSTDLLPVTGAVVVDYPGYLAIKSFAQIRDLMNTLAKMAFGMSQTGSLASPSVPLSITNLSLAAGATRLTNNLGKSRFPNLKSYFGRPGLVANETATRNESDNAYVTRGYDIIAIPQRIASNDASPSAEIRQRASSLHLLGGVLATRLEWVLMANSFDGGTTGPPLFNATRVFAAATEVGVPLLVLRPGTDGVEKLAGALLSESVKAELSATLATGDDIVVPERPVLLDGRQQIAWWRFEPASGQVIGVMPGGRGQAMVEETGVYIISIGFCIHDFNKSEKNNTDVAMAAGCALTAFGLSSLGVLEVFEGALVYLEAVLVGGTVGAWHGASM
jgi:hypothetical protein